MNYTDLINSSRVTVVEFFATWCPHCQRMMPVVAQVMERVGQNADIVQLDIDANQEPSQEADVQSVPTFIVYRDGREVWRQSGEVEGELLLSQIEKAMK